MTSIHHLRVYHQAKSACARAYAVASGIPDAALRDQMRRAATSVVLNISEGRGRTGDAEFARLLSIARGSNAELEAQVEFAAVIGHVPADEAEAIRREVEITGRMLSALIMRLRSG